MHEILGRSQFSFTNTNRKLVFVVIKKKIKSITFWKANILGNEILMLSVL